MKFINTTKNSVHLEDIKLSIPYNDEIPQHIDTELVKRSSSFQQMVSFGGFKVIEATVDRIEQNLLKLSNLYNPIIEEEKTRPKSGNKVEVILRGHFYETTGYSKVNRNLAINLYRNGFFVEIDPISTKNNDMNEIEARVFSSFRKTAGKDAILIDSVIPSQGNPIKGHYNILYTTSECCFVPKQFIEIASSYDEIWVTSNFSKSSFKNSGCNSKITVVPPIINKNLYKENVSPYLFRPQLREFSFLSVLTWDYRKGSDALLKSYCKTFTNRDEVSLVLLISEKSKSIQKEIKEDIRKHMSFPNAPHVLVCTKSIVEHQMPSFYKSCNAFVLPSRGEGFGLPFCEASLCGLPIISTNYGGQLDFLSENNSTLIDVDELEKASKTGIHYWDGQLFPSLKSESFINSLADGMRSVYLNYGKSVEKNKILQNKIIEYFSGEKVKHQTKILLDSVWDSLKRRKNDCSIKYIKQNYYNM